MMDETILCSTSCVCHLLLSLYILWMNRMSCFPFVPVELL